MIYLAEAALALAALVAGWAYRVIGENRLLRFDVESERRRADRYHADYLVQASRTQDALNEWREDIDRIMERS